MLDVEKPGVLVLYSETTALGRATIAAARAASVPSVALQHGLVYRNFYSRDHAPDEVGPPCDGTAGVPLPERTLVFGLLARQLFLERGSYRDDQIVVTGSPKFDALLEAERSLSAEELRRKLRLAPGERLLVVASRFYAIGAVFRDLVRAAKSVPGLKLLVKPHQAESTEPYLDVIRAESASRVVELASPEANLLELIVASDGLVTVDSFASSEALVLGRPVLVLKLPNNLQTLVDAGLALGTQRGEDPAPRLRELLDPGFRKEFAERRARRLDDFAFGTDGGSTRRILDAIYELADSSRQSRTR
jgi:CDP-glycerol glycerophosphotransferase (TagB/SpsB family)